MQKNKPVLLLINIGSPETLSVKAVKSYLQKFLMDPYVIQIPFILRFFLFYIVICNIRAPKTFLKYKSIWRPEGSPFHYFTEHFRNSLEKKLGFRVINLMMYSEPGFQKAFTELKSENFSDILVAPMYPQHAESSYVSSVEKFKSYYLNSGLTSKVTYVKPFYKQDFFIESYLHLIKSQFPDYQVFDHIVFSYHGLPQSHVKRSSPENDYQQQCIETTTLLAQKLNLEKNNYVTCFQSRVGVTKWITPYLDHTCTELAKTGRKNLLVVSPSFVVDGLETLQEIVDLETVLKKSYDIKLTLVKGLNSESIWIEKFSDYVNKIFVTS